VSWFFDLKVRAKLMAGFGVMLVLIAATGAFAVRQLATVNAQAAILADSLLPSVERASAMSATAAGVRIAQFRFVGATTRAGLADAERSIAARQAKLAELQQAEAAHPTSPEARALHERFAAEWTAYTTRSAAVAKLAREDRDAEAAALLGGEARREFEAATATLDQLVEHNRARAAMARAHAGDVYAATRWWLLAAVALNLMVGIGVALALASRIARTLAAVVARAQHLHRVCVTGLRSGIEAMGRGDLSVHVTPETQPLQVTDRDEIGDMARAIDAIICDTQATVRAFTGTQQTVRALVEETQALTAAAEQGRLDSRGHAERYEGAYRALVTGFNGTLDALQAPFTEASAVMQRVAERDMTARMTGTYRGDHAALQTAVNTTLTQLETELVRVAEGAEQVAAAAAQIVAGSQALAGGTTEQASSVEEISASLHEINARAGLAATSAREVQGLMTAATASTEQGTACVARLDQRGRRHPHLRRSDRTRGPHHRRDRLPDQPCWRSTPPSRRRAPATPAAASPWSPRRCAPSRCARLRQPSRRPPSSTTRCAA
jgi:methyl-accepting chemotaxis protein